MDVSTMAAVATNASLANAQGQIGIKVLGMTMENEAAAAGSLVAELANMPPPVSAGAVGGLLDKKV